MESSTLAAQALNPWVGGHTDMAEVAWEAGGDVAAQRAVALPQCVGRGMPPWQLVEKHKAAAAH